MCGLYFSLAPSFRLFAGDHGGAAIPVPIPNTEVKRSIAEGSAGPARARVGRRRLFFRFAQKSRRLRRTPASAPFGLGFAEGDMAFFRFARKSVQKIIELRSDLKSGIF